MKALVMGSDMRSFLTVVRSLGRAGIEVHSTWASRKSPALKSRYIIRNHVLAHPSSKEEHWKDELRQLLEHEQYDLIVPTNDPSLVPLHEYRDEFANFPIYLLNDDAYSTAFDKAKSGELVRSLSIPSPDERFLESADDLSSLDEIKPPYVLKPTRSFLPSNLNQKRNVVHAKDAEQARHRLRQLLPHSPVLVQEFFAGTGVGVEFLARDGEILIAFQHVRLHEPPAGGGSSFRRSAGLHPDLEAATTKIVSALNYTGVGMVEFLYNFRSGSWTFVEINGRFWGSLPLAVAARADFPRYLFEMLVEDRREFPREYRRGIACRNFLRDCRWLIDTIRANGLNPLRQLGTCGQLLAELRFPLTLRSRSDSFVWDDLRPAWTEVGQTVGDLRRRIGSKLRLLFTQRFPFRQLQRRRFRKALNGTGTVLFVCKGNICRSPFAERYAQRVLPDNFRFASCGYFPRTGRSSPTNAVAAAAEFGVDLRSHRSQLLTEGLIGDAEMVVTFDEENRRTVIDEHPQSKRKLHSLGTINENSRISIDDPYGGSVSDFKRTYESIKDALDRCAAFVAETNSATG